MNRAFLVFCLSGAMELALAGETARVTLFSNSLNFPPAISGTQTLSLTTDPNLTEITRELAPISDPSLPSYGALFLWDDPTSASVISGEIFFDAPPATDVNGNGFDDFLEVSQEVALTRTQGLFSMAVDRGTVTADWSRSAGASVGKCTVQMTGASFGQLPAFTFSFELRTFVGLLNYLAGTNSVTGLLSLTNLVGLANPLVGAVTLVRVPGTNRFDQLTLLAGTLTNATSDVFTYRTEALQRDPVLRTNYFGYFNFADGDLTTGTIDYQSWTWSIDDPNDSTGDGIPDLSDDPPGPIVEQPRLSLALSGRDLLLTVAASAGRTYNLEQALTLSQTHWSRQLSLTLTNNPQTVRVSATDAATSFWRLHSP